MKEASTGQSVSFSVYAVIREAGNECAWPTASPLDSHLTRPLLIMCIVSIPCKVRHALRNEPYPFASQTLVAIFQRSTARWVSQQLVSS